MALGQNNISITLIQNTLSVYSTGNLVALVGMAATGGNGSIIIGYDVDDNPIYSPFAFRMYENRASNGNVYDGYLISGARPYWNIWSNKIPAEWDYSNGPMELRLKRNVLNSNGGYDVRQHDFRGYDHSAVQPQLSVASSFNFTGGVGDISWLAHFHQIALPVDITHILAKVTIGAQVKTYNMPLADIIDSTPEIQGYSLHFTGVSETSGTLQLFASNAQGTEVATLGNIVSTKNFTINHLAQYAYLARGVAAPYDPDMLVVGNITVPSGTGNIQIAAGTTELTGITIRITAMSQIYDTVWFDIYLQQTGVADKYVGSYNVGAGDPAVNTDLQDIAVTLNAAVAAGDNLGFVITNMSY